MKLLIYTTLLGILIAGYVVANSPTAPDIGWPVELIPEPEASAYYDGARKIINDNQRNWVDQLAEQARVSK